MSHTSVIRGRASFPDIFGMAASQAQRAIDMACYCNAWSSGRLIVNLCQQMLEQQQAQSHYPSLCASLLHLVTYLMNLIFTAHWRLKLLVGSHLSHTHMHGPTLPFCFLFSFYSACCFIWLTFFGPFWGIVLRKIRSCWQTKPSGFQKGNIMPIPSMCHSEGPEWARNNKMAEDMFREWITHPELYESFIFKGALMSSRHASYLTLIFALKIMP